MHRPQRKPASLLLNTNVPVKQRPRRRWQSQNALLGVLGSSMAAAIIFVIVIGIGMEREAIRNAVHTNPFKPKHHRKSRRSQHELHQMAAAAAADHAGDRAGRLLTLHVQSKDQGTSLRSLPFPRVTRCADLPQHLPVDDFPTDDAFLPWIHDVFVRPAGRASVAVVAQNKRRCATGAGCAAQMQHWEPQMALFQAIPVTVRPEKGGAAAYDLSSLAHATHPETRFFCRFHNHNISRTTLSTFLFNYEYISHRKRPNKPMFTKTGKDVAYFEFSQLVFDCPLPADWQDAFRTKSNRLWLDIAPIRVPARHDTILLGERHVGPEAALRLSRVADNLAVAPLPDLTQTGRWANIPVCDIGQLGGVANRTKRQQQKHLAVSLPSNEQARKHNLVICAWAAAEYARRGDAVHITDAARRLREWLLFHDMVGVDHVYLYDNTPPPQRDGGGASASPTLLPLLDIVSEFSTDFVTYQRWPFVVCNNNRPNHANPGERSSQYAAETSCRERYGSLTTWMSFIDIDEYLVPLGNATTWHYLLRQKEQQGVSVLKLRSSRGRPRLDLLTERENQTSCWSPHPPPSKWPLLPCLEVGRNSSFLRAYNCDYIRPPKPDRFARAMKQIYRPDFVWSHFVHYATVTRPMATYYRDSNASSYQRALQSSDWGDVFLDDVAEGRLVHAKTVLPHETMTRNSTCHLHSKHSCAVGLVCPPTTAFDDALHTKNVFVDAAGNYCNCWPDLWVEDVLAPKLEQIYDNWMRRHGVH